MKKSDFKWIKIIKVTLTNLDDLCELSDLG